MKKMICAVIALLLIVPAVVSCGAGYSLDARALAEYLQYFDRPEELPIIAFEKAEFKGAVYYYLDRGPYEPDDEASVKMILVYDVASKTFKNNFWLDMEYGLRPEVLEQWKKRDKEAKSVHIFTRAEIDDLVKEAIEYCNLLKK